MQSREIDAVLISTCTGYLCPGLTSYVNERLACVRTCSARSRRQAAARPAEPARRRGHPRRRPRRKVLSVCVEVCSARFISMTIPACSSARALRDGAGAASREPTATEPRRVEWKWVIAPRAGQTRPLRFEHKNGCCETFCRRESANRRRRSAKLFAESLSPAGVKRDRITGWILTPRRDVLLALRTSWV